MRWRRPTGRSGLFTLTVPTGGGKTFASLSFALEHAIRHGLRRVDLRHSVHLDHRTDGRGVPHGTGHGRGGAGAPCEFRLGAAASRAPSTTKGRMAIEKLRRASENWDVPMVVTTAVQFFESLYRRNAVSRAESCTIWPAAWWCWTRRRRVPLHSAAAVHGGTRRVGAQLPDEHRAVHRDAAGAARGGWVHPRVRSYRMDRELAPRPSSPLCGAETRAGGIAARSGCRRRRSPCGSREQNRMLCIVNSRAHARKLFEAHPRSTGCHAPDHADVPAAIVGRVLADVRVRLAADDGGPVRLVATSLIEAGVDMDFPKCGVPRAAWTPMAQAAGRCNREGRLAMRSDTVVFRARRGRSPHTR